MTQQKILNKYILMLCLLAIIALGCKGKQVVAESNIDCLKKFVEASLNGDTSIAINYIIQDSLNIILLKEWYKKYKKLPIEEQKKYSNANVIVFKDSTINDSVSIIHYYNSYKKNTMQIKIHHTQQKYLVDFKHTFYGNQ